MGQAASLGKVSGGLAVAGGVDLAPGGAGGASVPLNTWGRRGRCAVPWIVGVRTYRAGDP